MGKGDSDSADGPMWPALATWAVIVAGFVLAWRDIPAALGWWWGAATGFAEGGVHIGEVILFGLGLVGALIAFVVTASALMAVLRLVGHAGSAFRRGYRAERTR